MAYFSPKSMSRLETCHPDLVRLFVRVVQGWDCAVTCGFRGEADQNEAYANRRSKLRWPDSLHNQEPSLAVDVVPCDIVPLDWEDLDHFKRFRAYVLGVAEELKIEVETISWDYPHYQLKEHNGTT